MALCARTFNAKLRTCIVKVGRAVYCAPWGVDHADWVSRFKSFSRALTSAATVRALPVRSFTMCRRPHELRTAPLCLGRNVRPTPASQRTVRPSTSASLPSLRLKRQSRSLGARCGNRFKRANPCKFKWMVPLGWDCEPKVGVFGTGNSTGPNLDVALLGGIRPNTLNWQPGIHSKSGHINPRAMKRVLDCAVRNMRTTAPQRSCRGKFVPNKLSFERHVQDHHDRKPDNDTCSCHV